jgi:hypothetical protein
MPEFYPKVNLREEIDIRPWSECSGADCQHPDCIEKRKRLAKIQAEKIKALESALASQRRTARKKLKRMRGY